MQDATLEQTTTQKPKRRPLFPTFRPSYDQTEDYQEYFEDDADYIRIVAALRGIAEALYELGLDSVDDNGNDIGDDSSDSYLD